MSASGNNGIAEIYRSVIADVINQVKESFLDENVDVDILSQLKKEWEDKVNSSGCVELEQNQMIRSHHVVPPAMRPVANHQPPMNRMPMPGVRMPVQPMMNNQVHIPEPRIQMQYTQPQQQLGAFQQGIVPQQIRMIPQLAGQQHFIINQPGQMMIVQNGQQIPVTIGPNGIIPQQRVQQQPQLSHQNIHQMDGNAGLDDEDDAEKEPKASASLVGEGSPAVKLAAKDNKTKIRGSGATEEEALKVLGALLKCAQLDGGGGGMSDSSSEEEDIEEEDEPLRRIAERIGDDQVEDGDQIAEEEPLNSADDQSDDEDMTVLFNAENVVMCQFEKVNRARTKWKFQLKDGIMHVDNKDYCFQKCSGEAEW